KRSSHAIRPAGSRSLTTSSPTRSATPSSAASTSSSTSDASQPASTGEPSTSSHSYNSQPLCYGCDECRFNLEQIAKGRDKRFVGRGHGVVAQRLGAHPFEGRVLLGDRRTLPFPAHVKRH